jgi:hypothetical protein
MFADWGIQHQGIKVGGSSDVRRLLRGSHDHQYPVDFNHVDFNPDFPYNNVATYHYFIADNPDVLRRLLLDIRRYAMVPTIPWLHLLLFNRSANLYDATRKSYDAQCRTYPGDPLYLHRDLN